MRLFLAFFFSAIASMAGAAVELPRGEASASELRIPFDRYTVKGGLGARLRFILRRSRFPHFQAWKPPGKVSGVASDEAGAICGKGSGKNIGYGAFGGAGLPLRFDIGVPGGVSRFGVCGCPWVVVGDTGLIEKSLLLGKIAAECGG